MTKVKAAVVHTIGEPLTIEEFDLCAMPAGQVLLKVAAEHEGLVTVEEGAQMGGAGSAVSEALAAAEVVKPVLHLGLRDEFIEHGDPSLLLAMQGLDAGGIEAAVRSRFESLLQQSRPTLKVVA